MYVVLVIKIYYGGQLSGGQLSYGGSCPGGGCRGGGSCPRTVTHTRTFKPLYILVKNN